MELSSNLLRKTALSKSQYAQQWLIWNESAVELTTRVCHNTYLEAEKEATRLARLHPGSNFYILEKVAATKCNSASLPPVIVTPFGKQWRSVVAPDIVIERKDCAPPIPIEDAAEAARNARWVAMRDTVAVAVDDEVMTATELAWKASNARQAAEDAAAARWRSMRDAADSARLNATMACNAAKAATAAAERAAWTLGAAVKAGGGGSGCPGRSTS